LQTKCDGLIVIGTALQTAFAKKIITETILKDSAPVLEVNLDKNIQHGYTLHLMQRSEIALPELFSELQRLQAA